MTNESKVVQLSPSWPGFQGIEKLFIFGDSYSDVGWSTFTHCSTSPTSANPLGVPFPGYVFNEEGLPNWVGHLITKYCPEPRYTPEEDDVHTDGETLLVYDYALGGATVNILRSRLQRFLTGVGKKPDWALWTSEASATLTWVGINDCAHSSAHTKSIAMLMDCQQELYDVGVRNFIFVDVPPIWRAPALYDRDPEHASKTYIAWNDMLLAAVKNFAVTHLDATVLLHSAFRTFSNIIDAPEAYGFTEESVHEHAASVWVDYLHPTSAVHDIVAKDMAEFLSSVPKVGRAVMVTGNAP